MEEENRAKEYDRSVYHLQMQSEAKNNFDLKKEIEGLKKENEGLKKENTGLKKENEELKKKVEELQMGNEGLMPAQNQNRLESSEPRVELSPLRLSMDTPPPLLVPPLTQTPTQQDISTDRVRQYFRDRSPEISEPMIVSDSDESDDDVQESDVQFVPDRTKLSNSLSKYQRRSKAKKTEVAKVCFQTCMIHGVPLWVPT